MKHPVALVALVCICACDHKHEVVPKAPTAPVTIPNPVIDPAAQKLDSELAPAYKALKSGRFDEVRRMVEQYTTARGSAAHRGQAEFVIGLTYHRQQFYDKASEHFRRALQLEPSFLETYYYAGNSLFNIGCLEEARAAYDVYARYKPDDAATAFGQGLVEFDADAIDAAEHFMKRAIELATAQKASDGDLGRYHARLGDVYERRDDFARARELYQKAANLRPESPEVWNKLANTCDRLGDVEGAQRARARAHEAEAQRKQRGGAPR